MKHRLLLLLIIVSGSGALAEDSFVRVAPDGSGKKTQSYLNTIGANAVHAQAVVPVNSAGAPFASFPVTGTFWQATQPVSGTFWQATQPVSGTFWQATQPVSIATNTPDVTDRLSRILGHVIVDTAPTTAVTGTFWPETQPISAASLPLPTGAATAAKQPAPGTAGTASADVLTVQGIASMTPLNVDGSSVTQPVSGTVTANAGTGPWPITDNGGSLTVDGTFWQATQPVSAASLPLPTGAATQATLAGVLTEAEFEARVPILNKGFNSEADALAVVVSGDNDLLTTSGFNARTPAMGQATMANSSPVVIASNQSAVPVSGTVTTNAGTGPWPVTDNGDSLTVDGTFWQATQPVSLATNTPTIAAGTAIIGKVGIDQTTPGTTNLVALAANQSVNVAQINGVTPLMGNGVTGTGSQRVTIASDNTAINVNAAQSAAWTVSGPTLTKGTQGATGFSVQDLKDAGRVYVVYTATALTAVTTEALISLTPYRDLSAGGAATTHAVTAGKRLRLQTLVVTARSTSTVNVGAIVRLRMLAGTVLVGSPVHAALGVMSSTLATAVAGNAQSEVLHFPEGLELSGTMQHGLTQLCSATTATLDVQLICYEY